MRMTLGLALKLIGVSGLIAAPLIVQVSLQMPALDDPMPPARQIVQNTDRPGHVQTPDTSLNSYQTATR